MRAWGSNSILRCAENWDYFRNSGILFRKQWKVLQMPDQQTCTTEYRIPYFVEEFFITEERLKCCQADRPFTWFVWDWVKWWLKKMLVDCRVVTSKLRGEHMKFPKGNPYAFPEGSKNCTLLHTIPMMWFLLSSRLPLLLQIFQCPTDAVLIHENFYCKFIPLLETSEDFWTGASSCFLWKEFCLQMPKCLTGLKPVWCNWIQWRTCIKIMLLQVKGLLSTTELQWKMKKVAERFISKLQEKLKIECVFN